MNRRIAYVFLFLIAISTQQIEGKEKFRQKNEAPVVASIRNEEDNTKYIQHLINQANYGDTVRIPLGTHYVRTIYLKNGVHIASKGVLKQLKPDSVEKFSFAKQCSSSPLFVGKNIHDISLSFKAAVSNEAVYLENCKRVKVTNTAIQGDSTNICAFSGIYLRNCEQVDITNTEVSFFGKSRQSPSFYQRGTGIRVQSSKNIRISDNNIHDNGENGLFFHACAAIVVHHNRVSNNGMSGIQVAFGSTGLEKQYKITDNTLTANAADAIDINNPDPVRQVDLQAVIEGNQSKGNGWVMGKKTRDGSGIATLVGLKNVLVRNNKSENSNRPAIYIRQCDAIDVLENDADNFAEIVGDLGQIHLFKNTFDGLRVLAHAKAKKLTLDSNHIRLVYLPNDIAVDSLVFVSNNLRGDLNINMDGRLICKNNTISSNSPRGAIALWKVNEAVLSGNQISATKNSALYIHEKASNVVVEDNKIHATNTCIKDNGSSHLKIARNTLASATYNASAQTLVSVNPKDLHLSDNIYYVGKERLEKDKTRQALGLEGNGTVYMQGDVRGLFKPSASYKN
ncbi:hypothetical protein GCM10023231_16940 [Olivibacter ginsenosidimutans]|uniref:Right handed beta helix domain-containing protein n=1 Tax=Olivibacter ginsenosidimutans TaxID=1176537 RepID=A0ABP9B1A9_9SPHI